MSSFESAISYLLDNEGVDSNDAADHGGRTRFGITHAKAAEHGIDIETLTLDQAKAIFKQDYWRFDGIMDQRVATKLLDMAANMGLETVIGLAQKVVTVAADGVLGPATLRAINYVQPDRMLLLLAGAAARRYAAIIAHDHTQIVFINDWIGRAVRVP